MHKDTQNVRREIQQLDDRRDIEHLAALVAPAALELIRRGTMGEQIETLAVNSVALALAIRKEARAVMQGPAPERPNRRSTDTPRNQGEWEWADLSIRDLVKLRGEAKTAAKQKAIDDEIQLRMSFPAGGKAPRNPPSPPNS